MSRSDLEETIDRSAAVADTIAPQVDRQRVTDDENRARQTLIEQQRIVVALTNAAIDRALRYSRAGKLIPVSVLDGSAKLNGSLQVLVALQLALRDPS